MVTSPVSTCVLLCLCWIRCYLLFQHLGPLISHSPGSFFQDSAVGSLEELGIFHKWYCYQHNSLCHQMCKTKTTKGIRANEASSAPSGSSDVSLQIRKGVGERRALLTTRLNVFVKRHLRSYKIRVLSGCTLSLIIQHLHPTPWSSLLPTNWAPLQRPASRRCLSSSHLTQAGGGEQMPDFAFKYQPHTERQHHGSLRGFHGDRMQATTSVNVIRALGLVCETGLISPPVESLWSRPDVGFIHWQTTCCPHQGSSAYGNPPAPELISTLPEQATGYKMLLRIGTSHYSNTWYPYSSLGGGAVS